MKLFGIKVKILSFSSFSVVLLFIACTALGRDCEDVKKTLLSDSQVSAEDKATFNTGVEAQDSCYLNLMGILLYEGKHFDKDQKKAEEIFYQLSNKDYPEAQFNFAWAMSKKDDQNPGDIINLALGIHHKYISDKKNNHLSSKARDLGRFYIDTLPQKIYNCSLDKCKYPISKTSLSAVSELKDTFEDAIKISTLKHADAIEKRSAEIKQNSDTIVAILSLGVMAYSIGSQSYSAPGTGAAPPPSGPNPWFNYGQGFGNPLNLSQFRL